MWQYLKDLNDIQENEGIHLGNKIRLKHIHYKKQKMKVRLAAQVFSKSVADALRVLKDDVKLPDFKDCGQTIYFIELFNDLFDILNSKSIRQFSFKKPFNCNSDSHNKMILDKLNECEQFILELKNSR